MRRMFNRKIERYINFLPILLSMRVLNETFDNDDFDFLVKVKDKRTWREFILEMAREEAKK